MPAKEANNGQPRAADDTPSTRLSARNERRQYGKSLRKTCKRSSHAEVPLGQSQRDPLSLLEASNSDRLQALLPIRFTRMSESPFAFYRGTAVVHAHDLQGTPTAGITVQLCGDCHLMNFGGFATPERQLVFDINDFDETLAGPFEWDVKRLAVSFVLASRWLGFSEADARHAVTAAVSSYRTSMGQFAEMSVLEMWYFQISIAKLLEDASDSDVQRLLRKAIKKAHQNTSEHVYEKITTTVNGEPRIAVEPPLLFRAEDYERHMREEIGPFFDRYRNSLPVDRRALIDRYRAVDAAVKVVGVGSVGTRCYIVLLLDTQGNPLFLQAKEARTSVLADRVGPSPWSHNGERVVIGQRIMQSASDIFLGWTTGPTGRDFYVRQLRDMKVAPDLTGYTPRIICAYADLCGRALARAHARAGDATTIAGYLGSSESFDGSITAYAQAYADQVEKDYEEFRVAIRRGRFPIDTMPSGLEQVIR